MQSSLMQETNKLTADQVTVRRASLEAIDSAWKIMEEYYEAAAVVARDSRDDFARTYFDDGAGVWLAAMGKNVIGCVALRPISVFPNSGEVKRLYVQSDYRGRGVAAALYDSLEYHAHAYGYQTLYLDTAADMIAAQKFYASLGYEHVARYNENPQAAMFMRKNLRPFPK
ncbi:MAG: GNAT family N-acetyltransferase [Candidatus Acidiferrum sp.]